ncbi:MAG: hypothetical protein JNK49_19895 [Planctomycetes bacterium]|nr:hypothetical protein [Planctomycetota bacterium]
MKRIPDSDRHTKGTPRLVAWNQRLAMAALLLAAGCASAPYAARAIEDDAEQASSVVVEDGSLHKLLRAGRPLLERIPVTNQLRVTVPVRNVGDDLLQIRAQMTFLDGKHDPIGDETPRMLQFIEPGHTIYVTATSQRAGAEDFVLRLAWNK